MPDPIAANSVRFTPPPSNLLPDVQASLTRALAQLEPDKKGALVLVATKDTIGQVKFNAAIVAKLDHGWAVQAYVGKSWGDELEGGITVMKSW